MKNKVTDIDNSSPEELYNKADKLLLTSKYSEAIELFSKLSQEYPYSTLSTKAQVMEIYCYYMKRDYDMAIDVADDFVKIHPANRYVSYILYLKTLSYYEQMRGIDYDQKITNLTKDSAINLINRFPNTKYARDFSFKLDLINDYLAGKEMSIGRFYMH
ncbi:MAG: outer membrane protein assembly factor BamD, partial [Rickettsiales bacterium]